MIPYRYHQRNGENSVFINLISPPYWTRTSVSPTTLSTMYKIEGIMEVVLHLSHHKISNKKNNNQLFFDFFFMNKILLSPKCNTQKKGT